MNSLETLEIGRDAIIVMFKISLPLMLITLAVGLSVSVIQTVTQIQEATLTFVPKIVIIFIALYMLFPFIGASLNDFMLLITDRIVNAQ
jgi:flagellar biosynthetic protein FliQ